MSEGNELHHEDVLNLLKYAWTGSQLPTSTGQYRQRLSLSGSVIDKISDVIGPLITTYATIHTHCNRFRNETYPNIVSLTDDVQGYTQRAGNDDSNSPYGSIWQTIDSMRNASSPEEKERIQDTLNSLVDEQINTVNGFRQRSSRAVADLRAFDDDTMKDKAEVQDRSSAVQSRLRREVGSLDDLESRLSQARNERADDQREYEHDKAVAASTPAYAWLGIFGLIAASTTAGIYGSRAADMARKIDALNSFITDQEGRISDEKHVVADLTAMNLGLGNVTTLIEPTSKTIQEMMGVWDAISEDLEHLKRMVDNDVRRTPFVIVKVVGKKLAAKWYTLNDTITKYRDVVRITDEERLSLDKINGIRPESDNIRDHLLRLAPFGNAIQFIDI